jgi:hypothetical protein
MRASDQENSPDLSGSGLPVDLSVLSVDTTSIRIASPLLLEHVSHPDRADKWLTHR